MRKLIFIMAMVIISCGSSLAQIPIYDSTKTYDVVTDDDSFYLFSTPKPCFNPVAYHWAPQTVMVQNYTTSDTVNVYGVAIPLSDVNGHPLSAGTPIEFHALLMRCVGASPYHSYAYSMQLVDSVEIKRSHTRFCWFNYENGNDCDENKSKTVPCYELYFDTPGQINMMTGSFLVGRHHNTNVDNLFLFEYGGEYTASLPSSIYYATELDGAWDYYFPATGYQDKKWGVFFPIIGFRCKPMQTYWLDAYNGTTAVLRWRSDGQDTLFNVRLVGEDGSDTTFVTSDTTITLTRLSDSVRYHVMLRKQCRYCTSNYDTTVYSDWTPGLYIGTTIPWVPTHTVTATSADYSMGVVTGGGVYGDSSLVTLTAYHYGGYDFDAWNDGDSANPRQFRVTCDTSFTAYFRVVADTGAVGILQPEDEDFLLRPNPAHGEVQILLPATAQGGQLAICDMAGRELMVLPVTSTTMKMDLGTLPQGTYLVKLTTATAATTKKLLIQ